MRLACWYHLYAAGEWREPLSEHLATLDYAGFDGPLYWGAVGSEAEIAEATDRIGFPPAVSAPTGFEQVTLHAVSAYAKRVDGSANAVMYAHSKGSSNKGDIGSNAMWRRAMNLRVVDNWRSNLDALGEGYDAVGCHWLTPDMFPGTIREPFFAGNFWMARCDYLAGLPACEERDRMDAELWVGLGWPRVLDVRPGWPCEALWADG